MSWLRLMTCAPERQTAGDILFLGGGGVVRALVPSATHPTTSAAREDHVVARQPRGDARLGTARAGTHWTWAAPIERSKSASPGTSVPSSSVLRPFRAESSAPNGVKAESSAPNREMAESSAPSVTPLSVMPQDIHCLHAPRDTMRRMEQVAMRLGRSESEVWAEAAREWLDHRAGVMLLFDDSRDDEPPPAAPAALPLPLRPQRSWTAIDALLADLRASADPSVA